MWSETIRAFDPREATKKAIAKERVESCSKCKIPAWMRVIKKTCGR